MTWVWTGRQYSPASIPGSRKRFFSFPKRPDRFWGPTISYPPVSERGQDVKLTTSLHQFLRLRMNGVTLLRPHMLSGRTAQSSTGSLNIKSWSSDLSLDRIGQIWHLEMCMKVRWETCYFFLETLISGQRSRYSAQATGWMSEKLWFDFQHRYIPPPPKRPDMVWPTEAWTWPLARIQQTG